MAVGLHSAHLCLLANNRDKSRDSTLALERPCIQKNCNQLRQFAIAICTSAATGRGPRPRPIIWDGHLQRDYKSGTHGCSWPMSSLPAGHAVFWPNSVGTSLRSLWSGLLVCRPRRWTSLFLNDHCLVPGACLCTVAAVYLRAADLGSPPSHPSTDGWRLRTPSPALEGLAGLLAVFSQGARGHD